jgi:hypothetical protein
MEIPRAKGYSIWLMFEKNLEEYFQSLINQFSSELSSPNFLPHITLIAGLDGNEDELIKRFDNFFHLHSFEVKCNGIAYSDEFYRSLYIKVEKDETLKNLFEFASRIFDVNLDFEKFLPHISLLYSFAKEDLKKRLIAEHLQKYPEKILITRIAFWKTKGLPADWKMLKMFELK